MSGQGQAETYFLSSILLSEVFRQPKEGSGYEQNPISSQQVKLYHRLVRYSASAGITSSGGDFYKPAAPKSQSTPGVGTSPAFLPPSSSSAPRSASPALPAALRGSAEPFPAAVDPRGQRGGRDPALLPARFTFRNQDSVVAPGRAGSLRRRAI